MSDKILTSSAVRIPFFGIYNGDGKGILDKTKNMPLGMFITNFNYEYKDEGVDECKIVIETDNVNIVDMPELNYLMPLQLQWGWAYSDGTIERGEPRHVVIKDHQVSFTPEGVSLTLITSDASFLLRAIPAKYDKYTEDFSEYVKSLLEGQTLPFQVLDYSTLETISINVE